MIKLNPTLIGFFRKEFLQTLRDPRNRMLLFVVPAIQLLVFGFALSSDVKNIRLAVPPSRGDPLLDDIRRNAYASGWFIPAAEQNADPFEIINRNAADAVLVSPPGGLTESVVRGTGQLQVLINAMNVTKAQAIENYLTAIVTAAVAADRPTPNVPPPIVFDLRILYNPTMRSALFLVPAVMGMIICIITIIFTAMSISKEKEQGTFETIIAAPVTSTEILLGKAIPFIILGIANVPLTLAVAVWILHIPIHGSLAVLFLATAIFVCVAVSVGILISTVCSTQQQSMMAGFLFLFPAQLLSGLMFPIENMPSYIKGIAYLNPLYYFTDVLRNIMLKGGEPALIARNLTILTLMAVSLSGLSFSRFRTTLR